MHGVVGAVGTTAPALAYAMSQDELNGLFWGTLAVSCIAAFALGANDVANAVDAATFQFSRSLLSASC